MPRTILRLPTGDEVHDPDASYIRALVRADNALWTAGSGDGYIAFVDSGTESRLLILPNEKHGVYLQHLSRPKGQNVDYQSQLSLWDPARLAETTVCADEWHASVGLFLPWEVACEAVVYFHKTGMLSPSVNWISPDRIPEGGNW